jgi:hypothetical protein
MVGGVSFLWEKLPHPPCISPQPPYVSLSLIAKPLQTTFPLSFYWKPLKIPKNPFPSPIPDLRTLKKPNFPIKKFPKTQSYIPYQCKISKALSPKHPKGRPPWAPKYPPPIKKSLDFKDPLSFLERSHYPNIQKTITTGIVPNCKKTD